MNAHGVSAVIPNYNGRDVLEMCLPSVLVALEQAPVPSEVIVVDDGSTDGSLAYLAEHFPEVRVIKTGGRQGQEGALNRGFSAATYPIVMQLDSDTRVDPGFTAAAIGHFEDEQVFAVAPLVYDWHGEQIACGRARATIRHGMVGVRLDADAASGENSLFASGCASFFSRDKVLEVGGYDPMYGSAHLDEIDLAYRGWKAGWRIVYESEAVAFHLGSATRDQVFTDTRLDRLKARNEWLFAWKNTSDPGLMVQHVAWMPVRVLAAAFNGRGSSVMGFVSALGMAGVAVRGRRDSDSSRIRSDRDVVGCCSGDRAPAGPVDSETRR